MKGYHLKKFFTNWALYYLISFSDMFLFVTHVVSTNYEACHAGQVRFIYRNKLFPVHALQYSLEMATGG